MDRTGLAPADDDLGVRWVAVRHAPDHIHIVATLARQDGDRPTTWNDFYRVRDACRDAERRFGLRSTAPADRTAARRATRAETEQAIRRGWAEAPRATLRREVSTAAAGAGTEQEFFARLHQAGVLVRKRYSTTHPGEVTGYAVGLPHHTASDGGVVWYGGGKLAADLTLPKLRARWAGPAEEAMHREIPRQVARGLLRHKVLDAAAHARDEAGFFARLRETGVLVRLRFSEINPGQVTGYAVALVGHVGEDGAPLWYGGGRLAAELTLPQLRAAWSRRTSEAGWKPGTPRWAGSEREALYRHAARQAATAAEHVRRSARGTRPAPPTRPGRRPTPSIRPPGRYMTRSCGERRTPMTGPPAHPMDVSRSTPAAETSCAPPPGCSHWSATSAATARSPSPRCWPASSTWPPR